MYEKLSKITDIWQILYSTESQFNNYGSEMKS